MSWGVYIDNCGENVFEGGSGFKSQYECTLSSQLQITSFAMALIIGVQKFSDIRLINTMLGIRLRSYPV